MNKKIGIFAGSFDPIHDGHLEAARSALKLLFLDELYILVEQMPYGVKNPVPIEHRRAMVDIALRDESKIKQLKLDDKRFDIHTTLPKIKKEFPNSDIFFIFGADVFMNMNEQTWPNLRELLEHYIVVFERRGLREDKISERAKSLGIVTAILPSTHPYHSSTDIRLSHAKKQLWIPFEVSHYIDVNNLYQQL